MRRLTRLPTRPAFLALLSALFVASISQRVVGQPDRGYDIAASRQMHIGGAEIQVDFASGEMDLPVDTVLAHVQACGRCRTAYFGRFPVARRGFSSSRCRAEAGHFAGHHLGRHVRLSGIHAHPHRSTHHHCRPGRRLDDDARTGAHGIPLPARAISTGWKRDWPPTLSRLRALRPAS